MMWSGNKHVRSVQRSFYDADGSPNPYSLGACLLAGLAFVGFLRHGGTASFGSAHDGTRLAVVTWNTAAINNNPFEYWITPNDDETGKAYTKMMADFERLIDSAGADVDVKVSQVFTQGMFQELKQLLSAQSAAHGDTAGAKLEAQWQADYSRRSIVSGFLKDKSVGSKRLVSMPDRYTNTVSRPGGGVLHRPTVINCYEHEMPSVAAWWEQWKTFMFHTSPDGGDIAAKAKAKGSMVGMLKKIKKSKYPAITEEEEAMSIPLQTLALAIFDAIEVHLMTRVAPARWHSVRTRMCADLNQHKTQRVMDILESTYEAADVIFLQEASQRMVDEWRAGALGARYTYLTSKLKSKRDQNSLIMVRKSLFGEDASKLEWSDVSSTVTAAFPAGAKVPIAMPGDLFAVTIRDRFGNGYFLASFHGDTNGLATLPVLAAVHSVAAKLASTHRFIFGLDANTYAVGRQGWQGVAEFARAARQHGMSTCWGDHPDPRVHTTYNARTFVQPQLNKAAHSYEKDAKGDKNPKDFVLFFTSQLTHANTARDNTGKRSFLDQSVFPTLQFPSDHGIVSTQLAAV